MVIKPMTNINVRGNSYRVRIMVDGVTITFGSYDNLQDAQTRRDEMRKELFGEFAGHYNG